jgi:hypothetical protein
MSTVTRAGPTERVPGAGASIAAPFLRVGGYLPDSAHGHVVRIDLGDNRGLALTLDPLEPEPGFPVTAHASMLAEMWRGVYGLPRHAGDALTLALLRAYQAAGWDTVTGSPAPGATFPRMTELAPFVAAAVAELGCDKPTRLSISGFVRVRLGELCTGAGRFFSGGHRLSVPAMLGRDVELATGSLDDTTRALAAGTLLLRLVEHARLHPSPGGSARHILVIDEGDRLLGEGVAGLIADASCHGQAVVLSGSPFGGSPQVVQEVPAPRTPVPPDHGFIGGLRTPACGMSCRRLRPCSRHDIRAAELLASSPGSEALRTWAVSLIRAFVTGRPLPQPMRQLRADWERWLPRLRECTLATIVDKEIAALAVLVRDSYAPARLAGVVARTAATLLADGPAPSRAGQCWVPPQARWLHEARRVGWHAEGSVDADQIAPPLDFAIAGLPDWPGMTAGQRLALMLRHPLSAERPENHPIVGLIP